MGYHIIFGLQEVVVGSGSLDAGLLGLQSLMLWSVSAGAILLMLRRQRA